jgi:hypothetical protein
MGLTSPERAWLRAAFAGAFTRELVLRDGMPPATVAVVDFMMYVKTIGANVVTKDQCIQYFVDKIKWMMIRRDSTFQTVIVLVDGKRVPVKSLVQDPARYKNKNVYASDARVWPRAGTDLIPQEWIRFAGNQKLMRRNLYAELFNAFISCRYFTPKPGQALVLSGFPGRSRYVDDPTGTASGQPTNEKGQRLEVQLWAPGELPITKAFEQRDPQLYHRVYRLVHEPPSALFPRGLIKTDEWTEARNDISESDNRMFYFDHWFRDRHIMFYLNDGDVFSIGALYAYERVSGMGPALLVQEQQQQQQQPEEDELDPFPTLFFRNWHTCCMPYKCAEEEGGEEEGDQIKPNQKVAEEYVDLNRLHTLMRAYAPFRRANVASPVLTMVVLLILAGSDFCPKFLHGMGAQNVIWRVFFENIAIFTHLVQMSDVGLTPDTRTRRTIVVDEDAFAQLIHYCFLKKYDKSLCKEHKTRKLSFKQLQDKTRTKADPRFHLPSRNEVRLFCRALEWNLDYWRNAPLGHTPDCFALWSGVPYYPYYREPETGAKKRVDVVASRPRPMDEVYAQHTYRRRLLEPRPPAPRSVSGGDGAMTTKRNQVISVFEENVK